MKRHLLLALVLAGALAACQTPNTAPPLPATEVVVARAGNENDVQLLDVVASYRNLTNLELGPEGERLRRAFAQQRSEDNRLRLAAYYALVPLPHGDRAKALALFDVPPSAANGLGRNHPLAQILIPLLQDARRSDEALLATQQKLRDEFKRSDALQQNNDILQKKLDDIRALERKMLDREKTRRKP
ncbi:hypothetical protein [Niveibacterium sp. SC-1]|uniref:hypothetical protein n=1 Tax=Niveibacterium sp. SC-1 TaxID=3135646 RepID=UPI00311D8746